MTTTPSENPFDLHDMVCVVTGGSRGLGLAIARGFAQHGAHVVIASRKREVCEAAAAQIQDETGRTAIGVGYHAGQWTTAGRLFDAVYQRFGRCDVLVNNAGLSPVYSTLTDVSEALFDKVVSVNFKGPFRLSALFGVQMAAGSGGSIINVSSIAAVQPRPTELVYAGAKAALNALTVGLAHAYAPTVRCNGIMPGPFRTDITKGWDWDEFELRAQNAIPLRRAGEADEVVGAALYFASSASSYTTATLIKVDGGQSSSLG